jgi:hypothetical protein
MSFFNIWIKRKGAPENKAGSNLYFEIIYIEYLNTT